jgi:hypothetical protein
MSNKNNLWEDSISENFIEASDDSDFESDLAALGISDDEEEYVDEELEEIVAEVPKREVQTAYKLNPKQHNTVSEAVVRLEQARLYDMLIKHDMFEGVQADPIAIAKVKKELKDYIVERLEILLGIRQEKSKTKEVLSVELPFNEIEIQFLKDLSLKGTKGASASGETAKASITPIQKPIQVLQPSGGLKSLKPMTVEVKPVVEPKKPVNAYISTLMEAKQTPAPQEQEEYEEEEVVEQPVKKVAVKKKEQKRQPVKLNINEAEIQKMTNDLLKTSIRGMDAAERKALTPEQAESLKQRARERAIEIFKAAKEELGYKSVDLDNQQEVAKRNRNIKKSSNTKPIPTATPIPDADTLSMHYQRQKQGGVAGNMRSSAGALNPENARDQQILKTYNSAMQNLVQQLTKGQ